MDVHPTIGWSQFALERHQKHAPVHFKQEPADLLTLLHKHWAKRVPGAGRTDLNQVVIVPIEEPNVAELFHSSWIHIDKAHSIQAELVRRQPHEDPYLQLTGVGPTLPTKVARVVLYSAATLLDNNGQRSGNYDWEIVALLAGPWENEPMAPLTMARNFLQKPGGTFAPYSAEQLAESIYFWSQFIQARQ